MHYNIIINRYNCVHFPRIFWAPIFCALASELALIRLSSVSKYAEIQVGHSKKGFLFFLHSLNSLLESYYKEIIKFFFEWHIIYETSVIEKNSSSGSFRPATDLLLIEPVVCDSDGDGNKIL